MAARAIIIGWGVNAAGGKQLAEIRHCNDYAPCMFLNVYTAVIPNVAWVEIASMAVRGCTWTHVSVGYCSGYIEGGISFAGRL